MIKGIFDAITIITIQLHCRPNSITENNNVESTESEQMTVVVKKNERHQLSKVQSKFWLHHRIPLSYPKNICKNA